MTRKLAAARPFAARIAALGLALAALSCKNSEAASPEPVELFRYSGKLITHVEQPESVAECGAEYVTYDTSGYFVLDRSRHRVRLEGFGCSLDLTEAPGSLVSGAAQPCVVDGAANFQGFGIEQLRFESFSMSSDTGTTSWSARAWRNLPDGRVSHCFELSGTLERQ